MDDLQELSRVEAHSYDLVFRPVDVSSLVKTVTKRLASQAEFKRIALDLELAPDLPHPLADEDRAVQALTNLTGTHCNTLHLPSHSLHFGDYSGTQCQGIKFEVN